MKCARLLIEAGADVNTTDKYMSTPLISASLSHTKNPLVQMLIDAGANVNHSSAETETMMLRDDGDTALHRAARYGIGETVTALLQAGAHVDAKSSTGKTALCYAALSKELVIFKELMKWGASALPLALDYAKCHVELEAFKDETDSE